MHGQTSRVIFSHQNKEKSTYKHMPQKEDFFQFNWKVKFKMNDLIVQYFNHIWQSTLGKHMPSLITLQFFHFVKLQFTTNIQSLQCLNQRKHGHVWSLTVAIFQTTLGHCKRSDLHINCIGKVSLYAELELNKLEYFMCPHKMSNGLNSCLKK